MSEARQLLLQMEHAEQRGDRQSARTLARAILSSDNGADVERQRPAQPQAEPSQPDDQAVQMSARELLARTEPDPFLLVVGILGLGLMVWLVYNYAL